MCHTDLVAADSVPVESHRPRRKSQLAYSYSSCEDPHTSVSVRRHGNMKADHVLCIRAERAAHAGDADEQQGAAADAHGGAAHLQPRRAVHRMSCAR